MRNWAKMLAALFSVLLALTASNAQTDSSATATVSEAASDRAPNGVYQVNDGVTPPRAIHSPSPKHPKAARKDRYQGTAVLWLVVDKEGLPRDIKVVRSLRSDLDLAAVDAVKKWKFAPATKDGKPVPVQVNVEVSFRLRWCGRQI